MTERPDAGELLETSLAHIDPLQSIAASLVRIADQLERRSEPLPIRRGVQPLPADLAGLETRAHTVGWANPWAASDLTAHAAEEYPGEQSGRAIPEDRSSRA